MIKNSESYLHEDGYLKISLYKNNLKGNYYMHRGQNEVDHINGDRTDHRLENLTYPDRTGNNRFITSTLHPPTLSPNNRVMEQCRRNQSLMTLH
jgi:hypothetical protein